MLKFKLCHFIARRLPRWLCYHAGLRIWAEATSGKYSSEEVPAVTMQTCLDRFCKGKAKRPKQESESNDKPNIGLATTAELLDELRARAETNGYANYRTVDCD